ncbi:murein biosynthesis integral membrane protein MurJ [Pontixanthobacter gangjinensis]|uniref:Probable lipid II flippase MurJ n=1 Tax=Pontixanthobacter gangjinensis TaxID=1028742 RepID=A0A6I4SJL9_9SPHN|nr:murein biosynthesis integral membrane protein MurJ [Pontixanthobacter gangjinensis]MXO56071.1 murein biosynthesis integral membrane protein MurJ [Pontixanthobacter gangjinensis]
MSLLKNVGTIGGLTMVSRLFGFVRDMLLARVLGAGGVADAWQLAFQLPNIFRRLFAEGAFASAFVPLFNRHMKDGDDQTEARRFASEILAILLPILVFFGAIMMIAMPWILYAFASEDLQADQQNYELAVMMGRIAFPYLLFMSLATLTAAVLNSLSRFAAAAAAPILLNICLISALTWGAMQADSEVTRQSTGLLLAIAVTTSGLLQLLWLTYWMRRSGFRIPFKRPRITPDVKQLGVLIVPAVFGAGVYQISRFIDLFFLSSLPEGSITFLAMADRWNQLPLGIIGIALGTAILPALSRFIASEDADGAFRLQSNAVELAMLLTIPSAVALFVTGSAFTQVFFVGGAFTVEDALITGTVVSGLVIGLPAYVLVKVLTPNFFARKDTRTPVYTAAVSLIVTISLNLFLIFSLGLGVLSLAIAGSIGAWCNVALLYAILARKGYFKLTGSVVSRMFRIMIAALMMGAVLYYLMPCADPYFTGSALERAASILSIVLAGALTFAIAAFALRVLDRETIGRLMRRQA